MFKGFALVLGLGAMVFACAGCPGKKAGKGAGKNRTAKIFYLTELKGQIGHSKRKAR